MVQLAVYRFGIIAQVHMSRQHPLGIPELLAARSLGTLEFASRLQSCASGGEPDRMKCFRTLVAI